MNQDEIMDDAMLTSIVTLTNGLRHCNTQDKREYVEKAVNLLITVLNGR